MKTVAVSLLLSLFLVGCATADYSEEKPKSGSPTGALLRGELEADDYLEAITEANKESRAFEQFEMNREPTRAFNTRTQRFQYVPDGTDQEWNEETQRWEFTPAN